jgi:hypothetical protein
MAALVLLMGWARDGRPLPGGMRLVFWASRSGHEVNGRRGNRKEEEEEKCWKREGELRRCGGGRRIGLGLGIRGPVSFEGSATVALLQCYDAMRLG